MGVQNLWKILDRAGYLIDLRDLEGKRLAIDISIWVIRIIYSGVAMGKSGE
jgi:DNA excision repair protein ERCC-5